MISIFISILHQENKKEGVAKVESALPPIPDFVPGGGQVTTSGIGGNALFLFATSSVIPLSSQQLLYQLQDVY
ncbi:hypothetical protein, partial [Clostridium sp. AM58-1XD]|uniref:hypothetical protein n=1 Tax=Clostridium sp. AM58-1XD TaxID=2292307 RepID=UPI001A9A6E3B